jgi:hypothetical protein
MLCVVYGVLLLEVSVHAYNNTRVFMLLNSSLSARCHVRLHA